MGLNCVECGGELPGRRRYRTDRCADCARLRRNPRNAERRYSIRLDRWLEREPVCARCGETFVAKRSDARFCSARCRVASHRAEASEAALERR